jgi:hypothetical protein
MSWQVSALQHQPGVFAHGVELDLRPALLRQLQVVARGDQVGMGVGGVEGQARADIAIALNSADPWSNAVKDTRDRA